MKTCGAPFFRHVFSVPPLRFQHFPLYVSGLLPVVFPLIFILPPKRYPIWHTALIQQGRGGPAALSPSALRPPAGCPSPSGERYRYLTAAGTLRSDKKRQRTCPVPCRLILLRRFIVIFHFDDSSSRFMALLHLPDSSALILSACSFMLFIHDLRCAQTSF